MLNTSKTFLTLSIVLMTASTANATNIIASGVQTSPDHLVVREATGLQPTLASSKFSTSNSIKIGPKGKQKAMTKNELRRKNPAVYRLYKKTERVALDFRAGERGAVPLSCSITDTYVNCQGSTWFCTLWFDNILASQCGPQPPSLPKS